MPNKLRDVFNKNTSLVKGTIKFKDLQSSEEFAKALESVYKEGKVIPVSGVETISLGINSGAGLFPYEKAEHINDLIIGPSPDKIDLPLEIDGNNTIFPVLRYKIEDGCIVQTEADFIFIVKMVFREDTQTATISIIPQLNKASNVDSVVEGIKKVKALLALFFRFDSMQPGSEGNTIIRRLDALCSIYDNLHYIEEIFHISFKPETIDLNDIESQKDLCEICLTVRDHKAIRINAKLTDTETKGMRLVSDDTVIIGQEIAMIFLWTISYSLWGEKIELYCTNLLSNAIVKSTEDLENGHIRIIYGENESNPMYISYKAYLNEADACEELEALMEHKEEYIEAKTVNQYMQEIDVYKQR